MSLDVDECPIDEEGGSIGTGAAATNRVVRSGSSAAGKGGASGKRKAADGAAATRARKLAPK